VAEASSLALFQEHELATSKRNSSQKYIFRTKTLLSSEKFRSTLPDRSVVGKPKSDKPEPSDKLKELMQFRRKNELCFKCGEKWSHNHTCPAQISLHVIEEVWEAIQNEEEPTANSDEDTEEYEAVMAVHSDQITISDQPKRKTMRLHGTVVGVEVSISVDSGSIGTFISEKLASHLSDQLIPCTASQFITADGTPMLCKSMVKQPQWTSQGHIFSFDAGVLPLQCFDMILGEDWLEACSPMWVHWKKKIMKFTYNGKRMTLLGIKPQTTKCTAISAGKLKGLLRRKAITHYVQLLQVQPGNVQKEDNSICSIIDTVPYLAVQAVIEKYSHLFKEPDTLPPPRSCDHQISLVPGATPVNIRAYIYAPAQKIEIERQLTEMLHNGIIRSSSSPYASPVLLVRKKDGTWIFCVDYRHLNTITVKNKHPMPIVEELIDELAGAKWFSKLDFRSGYHQIRVAKSDEHKTAFHTHNGLYGFLVMPFGLINAPATFQSVMNSIFEPLLRKEVLVFMDDILIYSSTLEDHISLLQQVFDIIQQHQFFIKFSKCSFAQEEIEYLGHCISADGVATEPSKVLAVKQWPTPTNLKTLRGFLGLTGYYRKFIKHYDMISRPLTLLLKKGTPFQSTSATEATFQLLKQALV